MYHALSMLAGSVATCIALSACQSLPDAFRTDAPYPQYGAAAAPDGTYFTQQFGAWGTRANSQIYVQPNGEDQAERPGFHDASADESDFYYSFANQSYCFISDRADPAANTPPNADIWCGKWVGGAWQPPQRLPAPVNSDGTEYSPVITASGDLYFASDRPGGAGQGDLYFARNTRQGWQVTPLGPSVNSPGGEWNLDVSPDGQTLIFEASGLPTNKSGAGDLYMARRSGAGWGLATPLDALNTNGSDLMPRFLGDQTFTFTSIVNGQAQRRSAILIE